MEDTYQTPPTLSDDHFAPYAGKWVAVIHGRVAGFGNTPQEARLMARHNRPKDEPLVVYIPEQGLRIADPTDHSQ